MDELIKENERLKQELIDTKLKCTNDKLKCINKIAKKVITKYYEPYYEGTTYIENKED